MTDEPIPDALPEDLEQTTASRPAGQGEQFSHIPADARPDNCPISPLRGELVIVRELPEHVRGIVLGQHEKKLVLPETVKRTEGQRRGLMAEALVTALGAPKVNGFTDAEIPWEIEVGDRVLMRGANPFSTHKEKGSETVWEVIDGGAVSGKLAVDSNPEQPPMRMMQGEPGGPGGMPG